MPGNFPIQLSICLGFLLKTGYKYLLDTSISALFKHCMKNVPGKIHIRSADNLFPRILYLFLQKEKYFLHVWIGETERKLRFSLRLHSRHFRNPGFSLQFPVNLRQCNLITSCAFIGFPARLLLRHATDSLKVHKMQLFPHKEKQICRRRNRSEYQSIKNIKRNDICRGKSLRQLLWRLLQ